MSEFPDAVAELAKLRAWEAARRRQVMFRRHAAAESGQRDHALPLLIAELEDVRQRIRVLRVYVTRNGSRAARSVLPLFARVAPRLARATRTGRTTTARRTASHAAASSAGADSSGDTPPGDAGHGFPPVAGTWEAAE